VARSEMHADRTAVGAVSDVAVNDGRRAGPDQTWTTRVVWPRATLVAVRIGGVNRVATTGPRRIFRSRSSGMPAVFGSTHVDEALKEASKGGTKPPSVTPEMIVGTGALGARRSSSVPCPSSGSSARW
jgi:hypothetical protein